MFRKKSRIVEKRTGGVRFFRPRFHFDRFTAMKGVLFIICCAYFLRLFNLQVLSYSDYKAAADGAHTFYQKLVPKRGEIFLHEHTPDATQASYLTAVGDETLFPAVTNRDYFLVYAVPQTIEDPGYVASQLAPLLELSREELEKKLSNKNDKYEPIKRRVNDDTVDAIKKLELSGVYFSKETYRYYPEKGLGGQLFGFLSTAGDTPRGLYGLEGYYNDLLKGKEGSLKFETDLFGALIPTGDKRVVDAEDGADLVLTIDRAVQLTVCDKLHAWVKQHNADGGTVVVMEPQTGAILAMCSAPDYEADNYGKFPIKNYPIPAIFTPYEPGSIFKPITMAIALDDGKVVPNTTYVDTGEVKIGPYTIRNSDKLANGVQNMTEILNKSLNTGTIFLARQVGLETFKKYVKAFGFGALTGIELDSEVPGTIYALDQKGEIYMATTSFGQGITTTPLQMTHAYATIANGGVMMQPYIVDEIIKADGSVIKTKPKKVRRVISENAATLVSGMMVTVVRTGHGKKAGVDGYYVAGKTGTAQVPRKDGKGYEVGVTIGSFAGFAPVDNPRFAMLVTIDRPRDVEWAESSAAPLWGELAKFLLNYYQVPPDETPEEVARQKSKKR